MKITKAQGRAAIDAMQQCAKEKYGNFKNGDACDAIEQLGWLDTLDAIDRFTQVTLDGDLDKGEVMTALAMCAAIAGVRPESEGD